MKLLKKIGFEEVIIPKHLAAEQLAYRIDMPRLVDKLSFGPDIVVREMQVEKFARKTLREIDLTNPYNAQIIEIKPFNSSKYQLIPKADDGLSRRDKIMVIGKSEIYLK